MRRMALIALAAIACGGIGSAIAVSFPGRTPTQSVAVEPSSLIDTVTPEPTPTPTPKPTPTPEPQSNVRPRRLPAPKPSPTRRPLPTIAAATPCNDEFADCPDTPEPRNNRRRNTPTP